MKISHLIKLFSQLVVITWLKDGWTTVEGSNRRHAEGVFQDATFLCYWRMTSLVLQTETYDILAATNMRIMAFSDTVYFGW